MRTFFDCIPCFVRQALDAVRLVTDDEGIHERVLREVLRAAGEMDLRQSPPAMGRHIHRAVRELVHGGDPYSQMKDRFNRLALDMCPKLEARIGNAPNPTEMAVRLAIAGNVIDPAATGNLDEAHVYEAIDRALAAPLDGDVAAFLDAVSQADAILYLADNAGEIVFDRLLIEQMLKLAPGVNVTVAVRGMAVLNDATMEDARAAGLTRLVEVIDNGTDVPGTILEECSEAFRERFWSADLVIAKGQGNYETLSEVEADIVFVLMAKCPVIARDLGCPVGSLVVRRSAGAVATISACNVQDTNSERR